MITTVERDYRLSIGTINLPLDNLINHENYPYSVRNKKEVCFVVNNRIRGVYEIDKMPSGLFKQLLVEYYVSEPEYESTQIQKFNSSVQLWQDFVFSLNHDFPALTEFIYIPYRIHGSHLVMIRDYVHDCISLGNTVFVLFSPRFHDNDLYNISEYYGFLIEPFDLSENSKIILSDIVRMFYERETMWKVRLGVNNIVNEVYPDFRDENVVFLNN